MGIGRITEAREVTQGAVHAPHGGAGESAQRMAAIGAHAGREAQRTIAAGLGDAAKNIGDTLKVVGDFAVAALWEKPIAEAEQEIRELDLKSRTEGWRDENGVEHPGFELYKGAEAAGIGDMWEAYMARESRKISQKHGLSEGQRNELSTRTRKLRVEMKARLTKYGTSEAMDSNLRDIDLRAVRDGEMNVAEAVASAAHDKDMAEKSARHSGIAGDADAVLAAFDDGAAMLCADNLVEKREKLIRDKVIGGLGRKSEEVATAEADKIVRAEALETVKALAAAGHYARARKLVEQGKKLGFDDAALAKGRELVDGMEVNAATAEGLKAYGTVWDESGELIRGRDKVLDAQIATLKRIAENAPKGSRTAIAALQQAGRFEEAADSIAYGDLIDGIAGGDPALFDVDENGKATLKEKPFDKKSQPRAARLWPKAVEAWERKETEEYRKNRSSVLGQSGYNAEEFIANDNPQGYLAWLDEQLDKGTISLSDRKAEKDKFMSTWARSPQMKERAKAMLRIVKEELGADFGSAIKGGQDNPEFDKDGSLIVKKGAELPEVTYGRRSNGVRMAGRVPVRVEDWTLERFSGEDFKYIMDHSLQFAVADGLKVPVGSIPENLQWMVSDDDRKNGYRTVNCVNDFGTFVRRLALWKRVKAIKNRKSTEYMRLEGELKTLGTSPEEYMGITNTGYLRRQMH